jgi:hypothetical protein
MSEKIAYRKMFGPKRQKVTAGRKKVNDEELHKLYFS